MELSIFSFLVPIIVAVYLAIDAPKHGKNPWLWGILGFLFTLLPLGIYLIKTDRKVAGWIFVVLSILSIIGTIALIGMVIAIFSSGSAGM
ncbi:hypothetical protein [Alkalihalobacillus sp. CinArs1]|uniref:hypothetical protein n=1 Tax=Alkalihalobacillus sp. CinArs1 TaxID=2995314 RepID=UPI0022DE859A|nr:hypothetical protein [Alkalihalobacillus sp. CinArs1]